MNYYGIKNYHGENKKAKYKTGGVKNEKRNPSRIQRM